MNKSFLQALFASWRIVVVGLLVGLLAGLVYWLVTPNRYIASVVVFVSTQQRPGDNTTSAYQGNLLSQQQTRSYAQLVTNERVTGVARQEANSPYSLGEFEGRVSATTVPDTVLVNISFYDTDPQRAAASVDSIGRSFTVLVSQLEAPPAQNQPPTVVARVVSAASVPAQASSPVLPLNLIVGALLGLLIGLGIGLYRFTTDRRIRDATQLAEATGAPTLVNIPVVAEKQSDFSQDSRIAEEFKRLRTNIQFLGVDKELRVLLITSTVPSEGKTTVARNLALAMASSGSSVLVIDADLRRPQLARALAVEQEVGVTSILTRRIRYQEAIQRSSFGAVDVVASGPVPPNPSELLASAAMAQLIADVSPRYDLVLIDAPPVLAVTDAAVLAAHADGVFLVCRAGGPLNNQLRDAVEQLRLVGANVLGGILNMIPKSRFNPYSDNSYGYRDYEPEPSANASPVAPRARTMATGGMDAETIQARLSTQVPEKPGSVRPRPYKQ